MLTKQDLSFLFSIALRIFKKEGPFVLISRTATFLGRRLFYFGDFYLYEHKMTERNEADYLPKIKEFTFKMISTNTQVDEIIKDGFNDIRDYPLLVNVRHCLDKGAIAFCFFIGSDLAHIGWLAMSEEAKNTFDRLPYHVDFAHDQACSGGTVTLSQYRGSGLMVYGYFKRLEFLLQRGYKTSRNAVAKKNHMAQRAHGKFNPSIYAKARYIKILRWSFWKEMDYCSESSTILAH
jgi:hypothetical protein